MAKKHTAGPSDGPIDEDGERNPLNYLRTPPFESKNPEEAKKAAKSKSYDLAKEIKNSPQFHDIQVILSDWDEDQERKDRGQKPKRGETLVWPNRPGMAAALAVGKWVVPHSSIKGPKSEMVNRHGVVQEALDKQPIKERAIWHGQCAEVGAVSDYLHNIATAKTAKTLAEAKEHFQRNDAEIFAHRPSLSDRDASVAETPACKSCHFMLNELGIKHKSS